jgi:hypothetical protein
LPLIHLPLPARVRVLAVVSLLLLSCLLVRAQEKPYFVTYSHDLEEPGNLEIETKSALGRPGGGNRFSAMAMEFEYGARAWWTTEFYLDGQATAFDSTVFTGFRWENRVRPLFREHAVNPVLYVEYENISAADKTIIEVVGHDRQSDLATANAEARRDHQHEAEFKLILSSNLSTWNLSENFIAEKNLGHAPWEFGYALAAARPLRSAAGSRQRVFAADKFLAGAEAYGGLGDTSSLTLGGTSHYIAPLVGWQLPKAMRLSFSPGFGLTSDSLARIYRIGLAFEFSQIGNWFHSGRGGAQ